MVVTIDCRDTITCKVTIVLCNRAHLWFGFRSRLLPPYLLVHLTNHTVLCCLAMYIFACHHLTLSDLFICISCTVCVIHLHAPIYLLQPLYVTLCSSFFSNMPHKYMFFVALMNDIIPPTSID